MNNRSARYLTVGSALAMAALALPAGAALPTVDVATVGATALSLPSAVTEDITSLLESGLIVVGPTQQAETPLASTGSGPAVVASTGNGLAYVDDVGDLDGDGLADVLGYVFNDDGADRIVAIAGDDGQPLWSFDAIEPGDDGYSFGVALGIDITGDGSPDIAEITYQFPDDSPSTVSVTARAGGSGQVLWERVGPYDTREETTVQDGSSSTVTDASHHFTLLGVDDGTVLTATLSSSSVTTRSFSGATATLPGLGVQRVGQETGSRSVGSTVTVQSIDGAGAVAREFTHDVPLPSLHVARLGDLDADGSADLIVRAEGSPADTWECVVAAAARQCTDEEDFGFESMFQLVEVATGAPIWSSTTAGDFSYFSTIKDVTGDGADEVLLRGFGFFDENRTPDTVLSGRDGSTLWTVDDDDDVRDFAGSGHDGQNGYVIFTAERRTPAGGEALHVTRHDGETGDVVSSTMYEIPESSASYRIGGSGGDLTGDGVGDVVLNYSFGTYEQDGGFTTTDSIRHAEDGVTGEILFDLPAAGDEPFESFVYSVGDLDGDGGADLVHMQDPFASEGHITFMNGATGTVLWSTTDRALRYGRDADLDGVGGAELLFVDGCVVGAVEGATGQVRWQTAIC